MPDHVKGSIQAVVISIDAPGLGVSYVRELHKVRKRGVIRIIDVLLVEKAQDGAVDSVVHLPWTGANGADVNDDASAWSRDMRTEELAELAVSVPSGSAAVVLIIEHHWAQRLSDAISRNGGRLLEQAVLGTTLVGSVERDLAACLDAEEALESAELRHLSTAIEIIQLLASEGLISGVDLAQAIDVVATGLARQASAQGIAQALAEAGLMARHHVVEAASAAAAAITVGRAAAAETLAATEAMDDLRSAIAIQTMRAMCAARIIDDSAAREAVGVLVADGIVEAGAARGAIEAVREVGLVTSTDRRRDPAGRVADLGGLAGDPTDGDTS